MGAEKKKPIRLQSYNPEFQREWRKNASSFDSTSGCFCYKCSAWRGELGLEPDFQLYLNHLIQIFDEVKRVLKPTGTCFVNLGDSYGGSMSGKIEDNKAAQRGTGATSLKDQRPSASIMQKSLIGIPERFVIAMTDRGWIRRNTLIWWKRNCMPASVTDRFTVDFEVIYFFVKSKNYWFEQQFEPNEYDGRKDTKYKGGEKDMNCRAHERWPHEEGRNMRCVWDIPTKPFKESHFAVFPEALIVPMIKAGCPPGGIVLDPFSGAGTTCLVAKKLERNWIGIELKKEYVEMANKRIEQECGTLL